jgi:hypothetical protein
LPEFPDLLRAGLDYQVHCTRVISLNTLFCKMIVIPVAMARVSKAIVSLTN